MSALVFDVPNDLLSAVGTDLGASDWLDVDQARIDTFADATDDHQWIHVDADRAAAGPYGTTIAHGYLTLALAAHFLPELIVVPNASMVVNYGLEKVRFPSPVPVGSRVRGRGRLVSADQRGDAVQAVVGLEVEVEGADKPACVADLVLRFFT